MTTHCVKNIVYFIFVCSYVELILIELAHIFFWQIRFQTHYYDIHRKLKSSVL